MAWFGSGSSSSGKSAKTFGRSKSVAGGSAFGSAASGASSAFSIPSFNTNDEDLDDNPFSSQPVDRNRRVPQANRGLRLHDMNIPIIDTAIADMDSTGKQSISKRKNPHPENDQKKKKEARATSPDSVSTSTTCTSSTSSTTRAAAVSSSVASTSHRREKASSPLDEEFSSSSNYNNSSSSSFAPIR